MTKITLILAAVCAVALLMAGCNNIGTPAPTPTVTSAQPTDAPAATDEPTATDAIDATDAPAATDDPTSEPSANP